MRIAAIYDVHGNLPALDAVLAEIRREEVDLIVSGGDVFPGPNPVAVLNRLMSLDVPVRFVRGNGDREVIAEMNGGATATLPVAALEIIRSNAAQLESHHAAIISGWESSVALDVDGLGHVIFCHATPRNDVDVFNRDTPDSRVSELLGDVVADVIVCGHTHVQFDRTVAGIRVVNAGSVGMPLEAPGAYWLMLTPQVSLRKTVYA